MDVRGFRWGEDKSKSKAGGEVGGRRWGRGEVMIWADESGAVGWNKGKRDEGLTVGEAKRRARSEQENGAGG